MPDAHLRLHGVRLVDDDDAPRRSGRRAQRRHRHVAPLPVAEHATDALERLIGRDVTHDGEDGVVRHEGAAVIGDEIVARNGRERLGRTGFRQPVRVEPVDQPVEHGVGDEPRIIEAHLQSGQHLLALPLDLLLREGGVARHVGQHLQPRLKAVLHHHRIDEREIDPRAGVQLAADEVDGVIHVAGGLGRRTLVEERRREIRESELPFRIERASGPHDHAHAHHRLLVVQHGHNLQSVRERTYFVRRELHGARRQRTRRKFGWPLRLRAASVRPNEAQQRQEQQSRRSRQSRHC